MTTVGLPPAFVGEDAAAIFLGWSLYKLRESRRDGSGPPFVMQGATPSYGIDDLQSFAAAMPRFASTAEALAANPARAKAAFEQAEGARHAREARKHNREAAK